VISVHQAVLESESDGDARWKHGYIKCVITAAIFIHNAFVKSLFSKFFPESVDSYQSNITQQSASVLCEGY
jgi:hypothetical protein